MLPQPQQDPDECSNDPETSPERVFAEVGPSLP
jgi:hypothetical protein